MFANGLFTNYQIKAELGTAFTDAAENTLEAGGTGATGVKVKAAVTASNSVTIVSNASSGATLTGKVYAGSVVNIGEQDYIVFADATASSNEILLLLTTPLTATINAAATITSPTSRVWSYSPLGAGLDNLAEALNETIQQYFFLTDEGFARNHVTGMAPAYTFTGRRIFGDAAQDYIFAQKYNLDGSRASSLKLSWEDEAEAQHSVVCDCTICSIQEFGGATTDDAAISFEIRFDGKPTVTP